MLRSIPSILSPDLLHCMRAMGHGDDLVIADANFPGTSMGKRLIRLDGISATEVLDAVVTLLPLDTFVDSPAHVMQVVGKPDAVPDIVKEFQNIIDLKADNPAPIAGLERFDFYDRARKGYAVIQTGETRLYGNIILTKGVLGTAP